MSFDKQDLASEAQRTQPSRATSEAQRCPTIYPPAQMSTVFFRQTGGFSATRQLALGDPASICFCLIFLKVDMRVLSKNMRNNQACTQRQYAPYWNVLLGHCYAMYSKCTTLYELTTPQTFYSILHSAPHDSTPQTLHATNITRHATNMTLHMHSTSHMPMASALDYQHD